MQFANHEIKELREELRHVLTLLEKQWDLTIKIGTIRYDEDKAEVQLTCYSGNKSEAEQREFEKYCRRYALKPEDYRKRYIYNGKIYELIGFDLKARRYHYLLRNIQTGEKIKFATLTGLAHA